MAEVLNKIRKGLHKYSEIDFDKEEEVCKGNIEEFISNISYLRNASEEDIINKFKLLFLNKEESLKFLIFIRNSKDGLGERRVFRTLIKHIANTEPTLIKDNIRIIPKYGRWDDLYSLFGTPLEGEVISIFKDQIEKDLKNEKSSNLGKWLKSENSSSKESKALGYKTRKLLNYSSKNYRKLLSTLRKKLNLIECNLSSKEYENINYENIPKLGLIKYKKAFYRNDKEKYSSYLKNKVNYEKFSPNKIIKYIKSNIAENKLNENIENSLYNILFKHSEILNDYHKKNNSENKYDSLIINGLEKYEDCNNLSLLLFTIVLYEKINFNALKNYYISFKNIPKFNKLSESNYYNNIKNIYDNYINNNINNNIDLNSALELLLFGLLKKNIKSEFAPKSVLFIYNNDNEIGFKIASDIKERWLKAGFNYPEIKLWNLKNLNNDFFISKEQDIIKISGYNKNIWPYLLESREINNSEIILNEYKNINFTDII